MIRLVPFRGAHFETVAAWFGSETETVEWGGPDATYPVDDAMLAAMLAESRGSLPARRCWSAERDGRIVGHAQAAFDWRAGSARLGRVAVAPEVRRSGVARSMLREVVAEIFAHPEIQRLELNVYRHNTAAISLYERLGFAHEGNRRSAVPVGDQRWDTLIMAMLRSDMT
jgi:RimJ/RimL family protein N-acetyltransferase